MKRTVVVMTVILAVAATTVAACQPQATPPPEGAPAEGTPNVIRSTEKTMFVAPELKDCVGVAPMQCMQVGDTAAGPWTLFYDQIAGFTYAPGYLYELKVREDLVDDKAADRSTLRYTLIEEVSKTAATPAAPTTGGEAPTTLEGTTWQLVSYGDPANPTTVPAEVTVTATFADGKVSGKGGCNQYALNYTVDGNLLTTTPGPVTMMACPEPAMGVETAYLAAMGKAETFTVADGQLTITYDGSQALTFAPQGQANLEGPIWNVTGYNNGKEAVVSVAAGTTITMTFAAGKVTGKSGCNSFNAPYTVDGDKLTIGPAASTRMMCPGEGVMEQEQQFLAALQTVATWKVNGDQLDLRTADGAMAVNATAGVVTR